MVKKEHTALQIRKIEKRYSLAEKAIQWLGVIAVAYIVKDTINEMITLSQWLFFIIFLLVIYDLLLRKYTRRKIAYFSRYNKKLEEKIDAEGSSSELTEEGETNPKDK